MEACFKLSRVSYAPATDETAYRSVVGALRYLVHTRPDLTFSVGYGSWFMEAPTEKHHTVVKHILRCIAGMLQLGCMYARGEGTAQLVGYNESYLGAILMIERAPLGCYFSSEMAQ